MWRAGNIEAYYYTLHPELQSTVVAFAEVEDSSSPVQLVPTNVHNTKDSVTLTRVEYEAWIRSQQVTGTSAPTATLAHSSKGSEDWTDDWWGT